MGYADWSGSCPMGKAEGKGTARLETSGIDGITGQFDAGIPVGEVRVRYGPGGTYVGGWREGEPDGRGLSMEAWGEGYEGGWLDGYRHGEGEFITAEGKRIPGRWERNNLIGSWYEDADTGCEVWFAVLDDPIGELSWTGECVRGRASGEGTIHWRQLEENGVVHEVSFEGTLRDGRLHGTGRWEQVDRYTNGSDRIVKVGTWIDGLRSGVGMDRSVNASFRTTQGYAGNWKAGKRQGQGRRYSYKRHDDGSVTIENEIGRFLDGGFVAGRMIREDRSGSRSRVTIERGRFDGQFVGYGSAVVWVEERVTGSSTSMVLRYEGSRFEDGRGVVRFGDGDSFVGQAGPFGPSGYGGEFRDGICVLPSIGFVGACKTAEFDTGRHSGKTCIVARDQAALCLKVISRWIA